MRIQVYQWEGRWKT